MNKKYKEVTLQNVVDESGVSIATVSRVLSGKATVRKSTYNKVMEAVLKTGYILPVEPTKETSRLIIVVIPDIDNPFYAKVVRGIQDAACRQNYECLIWQAGNNFFVADMDKLYKQLSPAGIVLTTPCNGSEALETLDKVIPIVQCCEYAENNSLPFVSIDDYTAGKSAIEYLIAQGRKNIAIINSPTQYKYARERKRGYLDALNQAGLEINDRWYIEVHGISFEQAYAAVSQILASRVRPDAIFAVSDIFGVAAINAAKRLKLAVPRDLSVIGFDNTYIGKICTPALTTISQPQYQMGSMACEILLDRLHNLNVTNLHIMLDTELILRGSTSR